MRIIIFIISLVFFFSCKDVKRENIHDVNKNQLTDFENCIKHIDIYRTFNVERCIKEDETGFFVAKDSIENKGNCARRYFNNIKKTHNETNFFYRITKKRLYPQYKILKGHYILIGSIVQYYGENDIPGVAFQLNIFDKDGTQIDYLIVYNRFSYELVFKYYYKFNDDISEITVAQIEEDWLLVNETGDIIGERKKPISKNTSQTYKITAKGFILKK